MRIGMRRLTRLTNAFSKRAANHLHHAARFFVFYNFRRIHKTLRVTPAMAAGVANTLHDLNWLVDMIDARTRGGS